MGNCPLFIDKWGERRCVRVGFVLDFICFIGYIRFIWFVALLLQAFFD